MKNEERGLLITLNEKAKVRGGYVCFVYLTGIQNIVHGATKLNDDKGRNL